MAVRSEGVLQSGSKGSAGSKGTASSKGATGSKSKMDSKSADSKASSSSKDQVGRFDGNFLSDSIEELRKISTPSRQETIQATLVTIVMVVFMAMCLFLVDLLFNGVMTAFLNKS